MADYLDRIYGAVEGAANTVFNPVLTGVGSAMDLYDKADMAYGPGSRAKYARENGLEEPLGDNSGDVFGGLLGLGIASKIAPKAVSAKVAQGRWDNWGKGADDTLLDAGGNNKTMYTGNAKASNPQYDVDGELTHYKDFKQSPWETTRKDSRHEYQRQGYTFAADEPGVAQGYAGKKLMGEPSYANAEDLKFIDDINKDLIRPGEGNMFQQQFKNKNVFDPQNPKHLDMFKKEFDGVPLSAQGKDVGFTSYNDLTDEVSGWGIGELKEVLDWQKKSGFDGQWVLEDGARNLATNRPDLARNVFDPKDFTNYARPGQVRTGGVVGGLVPQFLGGSNE